MSKWWRVYYSDHKVCTSDEYDPWEVPRTGVQIIAQRNEHRGAELLSQADYYYYEEDRHGFFMVDSLGYTLWAHLFRAKYPLVLAGEMLSDEAFRELTLFVLDDLPEPKTSWYRGVPSWLRGD